MRLRIRTWAKAATAVAIVFYGLLGGCGSKKSTCPSEPSFYLIKDYFPLNQSDRWVWEVGGFSIEESYRDGDVNLGEPFVDQNRNGVWDNGEEYEDLNANGKYDGPGDPWTPGIPFTDRNSNGEYDAPNGMWDEGEFFLDLDGNGICNLATTLTLFAWILYEQNSAFVRGGTFSGTFSDGEPGLLWGPSDHFSNDTMGLMWHEHADPTDWDNLLAEVGPIIIARARIHVGDSLINADTSFASGQPSGIYTWISFFEGVEDVMVPGGTFPNCLRFRSLASGWTGNMEKFNGTSYQWYAKNVGLVKSDGPGEGEYWILISASVGGLDYP
jgi:hypothetical protein